ncbi:MAG TPA: HTTM domain-containing protein [Polyangia bacterium]|jgi:hypothetical protein|nr:HTTM domain-containing protein [Polyangia bacterium]
MIWPSLLQLYGNFGFVQWAISEVGADTWLPSIGKLCLLLQPFRISSTACVHGVFAVYALSLVGLGLGWRTRPFAVAAWLTHTLTVNSGYISLYGVDTMIHICLFYCMWMPVSAAYSLDQWLRRRSASATVGASLGLRTLQLHLCIIYLNTGLAKMRGAQWWNGEAIWRALMQPQFAVFDCSFLARVPIVAMLACWIVMLIEVGYPFLIWPRRIRPVWVAATIALHLGIGVMMGLWMFSSMMILMTFSAFGFALLVKPHAERASS